MQVSRNQDHSGTIPNARDMERVLAEFDDASEAWQRRGHVERLHLVPDVPVDVAPIGRPIIPTQVGAEPPRTPRRGRRSRGSMRP